MARTTDHALSKKGRGQCLDLRDIVVQSHLKGDADAQALIKPDAFYVSPLTRAIQTAVIAFGPMRAEQRPPGETMLMGSAREKQNVGGLDSMSDKKGTHILYHAYQELLLMEDEGAVAAFRKLRWDIQDAENEWWCPGNSDSPEELDLRLKEFMCQLLYTPHQTCVVVGHSHFFRAVFKGFMSKDFKDSQPELARRLTKDKMDNCGVIRMKLDPTQDLQGPITNVELVLGSVLIADAGGLACCAAPPLEQHEIKLRQTVP